MNGAADDAKKETPANPACALTAQVELFCSYSHKDKELRAEFESAVAILRRKNWVEIWTDQKIEPGGEWAGEINDHLRTANVIVLLVSNDFINSDFCYTQELKVALERQQRGDAELLPVILRPCDWQEAPFAALQALPPEGKAVTLWPNRDEAWFNVAKGVKQTILSILKKRNAVNTALCANSGPATDATHLPATTGGPGSTVQTSFHQAILAEFLADNEKAQRIYEQIARDAKAQRAEREKIQRDLQAKIFAIDDDLKIEHPRRAQDAFNNMDKYIRG